MFVYLIHLQTSQNPSHHSSGGTYCAARPIATCESKTAHNGKPPWLFGIVALSPKCGTGTWQQKKLERGFEVLRTVTRFKKTLKKASKSTSKILKTCKRLWFWECKIHKVTQRASQAYTWRPCGINAVTASGFGSWRTTQRDWKAQVGPGFPHVAGCKQ